MKEVLTITHSDLTALAERIISVVEQLPRTSAAVVLLEGDLGAGKTTFTQVLASYVGVSEHVHSPTFILKKEYTGTHPTFKHIVHVDAYRFTHPSEAKVLRLEDDLEDRETLVVIEWPSKMHYMKADVTVSFVVVDDDTREVTLTYGE